ncbi:hydrolase [Geomonas limicola]|uniref:Hydrolase n=1 Tax=Geomonas limicola TaxID=2740186 RepID=A0A6V8N661_9BACT|nr:alpha/beta hydrolase [Geomonas limicola]GFO67053.1 hydrolase [Geomonas limicola]
MSQATIGRFNVRVIGSGDTTLVLAHGFGASQHVWEHQVSAFRQTCRIVLFDHIGCAANDAADNDLANFSSLDFHRDNILAIYDALNLQRTVFVGHSVSSMLGVAVYLARPELFERMIFVAGSPCYLNTDNYLGGFSRDELNRLYSSMAADYFKWANGFGKAVSANPGCPSLGEFFAGKLSSMRPDVAQLVARAIFELDYRAHLENVGLPVLILQAHNDLAVPEQVGRYLHDKLPDSRLVLLDAEGHLPQLSAPEQVNQAIRAFLETGS